MSENYDDFVARPKLLALCESTPPASGPKVVQKLHFVNYNYVLNERLPKPEFLKSTTSICLACWLAALCTRVREIRRIRRSSGCTLHTCSRNTTNPEIQQLYLAHVFEEYDEFGAAAAALCTRAPGIRRIRSSSGCVTSRSLPDWMAELQSGVVHL